MVRNILVRLGGWSICILEVFLGHKYICKRKQWFCIQVYLVLFPAFSKLRGTYCMLDYGET